MHLVICVHLCPDLLKREMRLQINSIHSLRSVDRNQADMTYLFKNDGHGELAQVAGWKR
ncbi:hypothetical protein D3C81_1637680 [compost metagenome]